MAKRTKRLSNFFTTNPLQTGFGILVSLSFIINLGVLLFVILVARTPYYDLALQSQISNKICSTDYSTLISNLDKTSSSPAASNKLFTAVMCFRDTSNGKAIDINSIKPLN